MRKRSLLQTMLRGEEGRWEGEGEGGGGVRDTGVAVIKRIDYKSRKQLHAAIEVISAAASRAKDCSGKRPDAAQGNNGLARVVSAFRLQSIVVHLQQAKRGRGRLHAHS